MDHLDGPETFKEPWYLYVQINDKTFKRDNAQRSVKAFYINVFIGALYSLRG